MRGPEPLRVCQVAHGWPPERIGGVELVARALHEGLVACGVEDRVFCAGDTALRTPDRLQVPGPVPHPRSFADTLDRPEVEHAFREWILGSRPHVVHFHHLTHLSLGLVRVARECGALPLMTLHDYWMVCARGQLVDRTLSCCPGPSPARCARCVGGQLALEPSVAGLRRLLPWLGPAAVAPLRDALGALRRPALERVARLRIASTAAALGRVARFASPSRDLARRFAAFGVPIDRIDAVELPCVQPLRPAPDPGTGPVRLLFMGALIPTKGAHLLVEAFARLPAGAATLRIIGPQPPSDVDPTYARRLADRIRQLPGARLDPPFAPGGAQDVLDAADVLVVPSLWQENSPLVLREARAAGLRAVASRRGGIPELTPEARLVEPDVGDLLSALAAECARGRGRIPARAFPDPIAHAAAVQDWYRDCLSRQRGPRAGSVEARAGGPRR